MAKELHIVCDDTIESYEIYNTTGHLIDKGRRNRVNVSELLPGLYTIVLNRELREKFVKY